MGGQKADSKNISRVANVTKSKGCVVVQTCDSYLPYWDSFFWSFKKYWDKSINWPVFFCNEEIAVDTELTQLPTGPGSHSTRLAKILDSLEEYEYVFYMLEDFWLTNQMTKEMFLGLFERMHNENWDSLRVAPLMPAYYKVIPTNFKFKDQKILKLTKDSDWQFSQQAAFWKRTFLRQCVVEPETTEAEAASSIVGEIAMDKYLKKTYPDAKIYLYNYYWYPISGAVWRGKLTQIGEQIEFLRQVDIIHTMIQSQPSSKSITFG